MGDKYTYKCTKCGYSKLTSGKLDWVFFAVVEPYTCNDCKELTDVLVGNYGIKRKPEELSPEEKKEYFHCSECNSKNITLWNIRRKPCPKCGIKMKIDINGDAMLWD